MTAAAQLRLFTPEPLADLGEIDIRPRLANRRCYEGYDLATLEMPGRNHPLLARELCRRFGVGPDSWVFDPFAGAGTFLCEAARLGATVAGVEISPLATHIAVRNLQLAGLESAVGRILLDRAECVAAHRFGLADRWQATHIFTSPVYPGQNHHSGYSDEQTRLRNERAFKAQQQFLDSDKPGHLASVPPHEFWRALSFIWRGCLTIARPDAALIVVTKDRVMGGEIVPFTRQVVESLTDAGWHVRGLLWRRLDASNTQRMQMWHAERRRRHYPFVDHEDCIVARVPGGDRP